MAKVWTCGYNADPVGFLRFPNKTAVTQHGQNFALQLDRQLELFDSDVSMFYRMLI